MSSINAHLDCWIRFHAFIRLIVTFIIAHSCSDFPFGFRSSDVGTPQYPLRSFHSDVKFDAPSSFFDRQTILLVPTDLVTFFHKLRETDEVIVTLGNDVHISQFNCKLVVAVLVTIHSWKINFHAWLNCFTGDSPGPARRWSRVDSTLLVLRRMPCCTSITNPHVR